MKITAVGGYKAVGRNMTGITINDETVAIDNGIRLDTLQIYDDDTNELRKRPVDELIDMDIITEPRRLKNIKVQIVSHGHLDHYGAIPIHKPKIPIISTPYTVEIIRSEYKDGIYKRINYGEDYEISSNFSVEFVEITHSIPYTSVVVLHTLEGDIVYASDFRFDNNSLISKPDYKRLREIGKGNVKVLLAESTRVKYKGKTPSEEIVRKKLNDIIKFIDNDINDGIIITTTFSTHIERIQSILYEIEKTDRTPIILGRSLSKNINLAKNFDLIDLPHDIKIFSSTKALRNILREIDNSNRNEYFLIVTGHQGEPDSVLSKMIDNRLFGFQKNDSVIFCADVIPTPLNEASRYALETKLRSFGVRIFDNVHVSGHSSREDHRYLINLLKPEHIIPCHGSMEMRGSYAELATEEGYEIERNLHLLTNGKSIEI